MSTNTQKSLSEKTFSGQPGLKRSPITAIITANLFREVAKVKNLRKRKTILGTEEEVMDASVTDELVADHEWESMLHTFEPEAGEHSPGVGGAESDDLWERLSTTRWLKTSAPSEEGFEEAATPEGADAEPSSSSTTGSSTTRARTSASDETPSNETTAV